MSDRERKKLVQARLKSAHHVNIAELSRRLKLSGASIHAFKKNIQSLGLPNVERLAELLDGVPPLPVDDEARKVNTLREEQVAYEQRIVDHVLDNDPLSEVVRLMESLSPMLLNQRHPVGARIDMLETNLQALLALIPSIREQQAGQAPAGVYV